MNTTQKEQWMHSSDIKVPGYYWCRLTDTDRDPSVVKINNDTEASGDFGLFEFECDQRQSLNDYKDHTWEFMLLRETACPHCNGMGFVIYTAGGDTRRSTCGCVEKASAPNATTSAPLKPSHAE